MSDFADNHVEIERAVLNDVTEIMAIERLSYDCPWRMKQMKQVVAGDTGQHVYTAKMNGDIAGFAICTYEDRVITLDNIAVHPKFRRQGIGRQMVDMIRRKLSPRRKQVIVSQVWEDNLLAQQFFRGAGFVAVRIVEHTGTRDYDDWTAIVFQWHCRPAVLGILKDRSASLGVICHDRRHKQGG